MLYVCTQTAYVYYICCLAAHRSLGARPPRQYKSPVAAGIAAQSGNRLLRRRCAMIQLVRRKTQHTE